MSARAVISGVLYRAPQTKTSKAGNPYAIATIREGKGDAVRWWKALAFSETTIEELMRLGDGDPVAVAGEFDCELYTPAAGGDMRMSWRITADAVLSARPRPKKPKPTPQDRRPPNVVPAQGGGFDDPIPF